MEKKKLMHHVLQLSTNCSALVKKVLNDSLDIECGLMTIAHLVDHIENIGDQVFIP